MGTDFKLLENRFKSAAQSYDDNAQMQIFSAQKLLELAEPFIKNPKRVLEVGAGSGILTKMLLELETFEPEEFFINDIVDAHKNWYEKIGFKAIIGNIEHLNLPENLNLIVSSSCFQWVKNIEGLFKKIAEKQNKNDVIAFSTYGENHFRQIKALTGVSLDYVSISQLKNILENIGYKVKIDKQMSIKLIFNSAKDILKYFSKTGVNAIKEQKWTPKKFKTFEQEYKKSFSDNDKLFLDVHYIWIIASRG